MPVCELPTTEGNLLLVDSLEAGGAPVARYLSAVEKMQLVADAGEAGRFATFYLSHFADCPAAAKHRKKKTGGHP